VTFPATGGSAEVSGLLRVQVGSKKKRLTQTVFNLNFFYLYSDYFCDILGYFSNIDASSISAVSALKVGYHGSPFNSVS
jgi:hypothetical protein